MTVPNRNKIIKAIEHCIAGGDCKHCTYGKRCEMIQDRVSDCHALLKDTLVLLKGTNKGKDPDE